MLLPAAALTWTSTPASLGTVSATGEFTAASTGSTLGTVTATAGGASGSSSVAVGQTPYGVDPLSDISTWGVSDAYMNVYPRRVASPGPHRSVNGSLSFDPDVSPPGGSSGSFDAHYTFAGADKTYDFDVFLNDPESEQIAVRDGRAPIGIGLWVKGIADLAGRPGAPLAPGIVSLNVGVWQATNQPTSVYPTGITFDGWQCVVAKLRDSRRDGGAERRRHPQFRGSRHRLAAVRDHRRGRLLSLRALSRAARRHRAIRGAAAVHLSGGAYAVPAQRRRCADPDSNRDLGHRHGFTGAVGADRRPGFAGVVDL